MRQLKRTGGVVTVNAHWAAWASAGPIGTSHEWEIVSCEAIDIVGKCEAVVF